MGVSTKFINIVRNLYKSATIRVRNQNVFSPPVNVDIGVLQGEILSPLLFALFLNDMESFLRNENCRGIPVNPSLDILLLAYADDLVITVESSHMMLGVLRSLQRYCEINQLNVNIKKTKIVIFRKRGGKISKKIPTFYYDGKIVDLVDKYEYLGIPFTASGKFRKTSEKFISASRNAMGAVLRIFRRTGIFDWRAVNRLLDSLIMSVLLYASHIWALEYLDQIEKVQLAFLNNY